VDGKEPSLLVRCRESQKMESLVGGFERVQFSADGKRLYFVTPAWATSGAVHVVDTTNRKERYLFPGNEIKIVKSGEYRDCLLVQQHRYFVGGGSYDWYWLLRADGKEVGPIGEDTSPLRRPTATSSDKARSSNTIGFVKQFLEFVIRQLVEFPDEMMLSEIPSGKMTIFRVQVRQSDVGRVIGRNGQTIHAIRALLASSAARHGQRATLEIVE
jgi:predicted RNA-binding protein YlqC (UPF0109 family)